MADASALLFCLEMNCEQWELAGCWGRALSGRAGSPLRAARGLHYSAAVLKQDLELPVLYTVQMLEMNR